MLESIHLREVGPSSSLDIDLSERVNIFTGDNGLGKTFILDIAWWALSGSWAGPPAVPRRGGDTKPRIEFEAYGGAGQQPFNTNSRFDFPKQEWVRKLGRPVSPGLVIYARVDGSFSLWDSARTDTVYRTMSSYPQDESFFQPWSFHFTNESLWNGMELDGRVLCNGLIRDWVSWQVNREMRRVQDATKERPASKRVDGSPFEMLEKAIKGLVAAPGEPLRIGTPVRLSVRDVRDIPTLIMPYGEVPLPHASAGLKRIVSLAYLLTWAWEEHKQATRQRKLEHTKHIVLLIDEVETHLHPRWQRDILPSLLNIADFLGAKAAVQVIATTHSPLVLASAEPYWDADRDSLFLFEIEEPPKQVSLRKLDWAKHGDVVGWLTSPVFGLDQARSKEAEIAIEAAEAFMRGDTKQLPPGLKSKAAIQKALERSLAGMDPFWPRWIVEGK